LKTTKMNTGNQAQNWTTCRMDGRKVEM